MPTWICPSCNATMTVKPALLGQKKPCVQCGVPSVITDAETLQADPDEPLSPILLTRSKTVTLKRMSTDASQPEVPVGASAKLLLGISVAGLLGCGIFFQGYRDARALSTLCFAGSIATFILAVTMWPIYTMADDTRANRRLLEQLASK